MRELALAGFVAIAFGLGSFYATNHFGAFNVANLALGTAALVVALVLGARRVRVVGGPHSRRVLLRGGGWVVLALVVGVGFERTAAWSGLRWDWTFEGRYVPAPATVKALKELCGPVEALLFYDPLDPRIRRTRLLLQTLARYGDLHVRELQIDQVAKEIDEYGVGTSNSVVLRLGDHFELADRPTEGAIYEALYRLCSTHERTIVALRGEGEGDLRLRSDVGFSGLAAALQTEGYRVRSVVTAALSEIPDDADAVLVVAPRRRMPETGLAALRRYLARGGHLVALLEPGTDTGVEGVLAEWGIRPLPGVIVDPASGAIGEEAVGTSVITYNYETHPVTAGLDRNRMTYFPGVRPFALHKTRIDDHLDAVVLSSPRAWVADVGVLHAHVPPPGPPASQRGYQRIAVAGRYDRDGVRTRIFAVGDADFASNRYLRTLYNLDLVLNGVHWTLEREPAITLRPKIRETVQFPLPLTDTIQTLYGVGLLIPELLLITGGVVWLRRRAA